MLKSSAVLRAELPRPEVSVADAQAIFEANYGLAGPIVELGSQQDRNFRIEAGDGRRYVLKVCHAEYSTVELEAQHAAMKHLAAVADAPMVPLPVAARSGEDILKLDLGGQPCQVRLLDYLDGQPLTGKRYLPEASIAALGAVCGRAANALAAFRHPGLIREIQWDLRQAVPVAQALLGAVTDAALRQSISDTMDEAGRAIAPLVADFRLQAIHHDITDDNVVARPDGKGRPIAYGVIDFGDLMEGWLVADLATTCASLLHHVDGDPFRILPAIRAFHAAHPLNRSEAKALWPLVVQRAGVLVASGEHQNTLEPDNDYALRNLAHERVIYDVATAMPLALMQAAILDALDMSEPPATPELGRLLPDIDPARFSIVRMDTRGPRMDRGNWLDADVERRLLEDAAGASGAAISRYGEFRLTRTRHHGARAPETCALFVAAMVPPGTSLAAPFVGMLSDAGDRLVLRGQTVSLFLGGVLPGIQATRHVSAGESLGNVNPDGIFTVQLCTVDTIDPQLFCTPHQARAWQTLCPSPSALFAGNFDAPPLETDRLFATRQAHFAHAQKNYYAHPPQIERGWREHMYATDGRTYLDMVNNVAILGHGHEKLAAAVGRQWSLLNTNSRFHYAGIAEFSKRLADLAPEGLDTVFLVNSGSEAVDLALRLAWAHSGARNIVSLLEAYHGWTVASDAVSTSIADNPQALSTRPDWVHPVTSPNTYRGPYRGPESAAGYVAAVQGALDRIDARGEKLAGFIAESVYGNSGGIPLPKGYLREVYRLVRERGGIAIADEVQVGYGRLGHYFWGIEEQGVVPDIITIAKGMGNGHPLGAVITRRAIADSLEREGYFFSSAGGSPVSCTVGMTVLDAMADERLQENARAVGDHLKARLEALGQRFDLVGAVHGMGLYLGLEFVRDRATLEPATAETEAICNRLLDLGIIMQPTGDHLNVLKIKPPLCLTRESADFFADMLAKVLEEGW
jgi:4-aminobutyrate aminotransferase-like enzyme/Ser/Thr protein kinase RdoA (MazF antagonist)